MVFSTHCMKIGEREYDNRVAMKAQRLNSPSFAKMSFIRRLSTKSFRVVGTSPALTAFTQLKMPKCQFLVLGNLLLSKTVKRPTMNYKTIKITSACRQPPKKTTSI